LSSPRNSAFFASSAFVCVCSGAVQNTPPLYALHFKELPHQIHNRKPIAAPPPPREAH
jgi:hypothetical protein